MNNKQEDMVEIIDKSSDTIKIVSKDYKIKYYDGKEYALKELEPEGFSLHGIIIYKNGEMFFCLKNLKKEGKKNGKQDN